MKVSFALLLVFLSGCVALAAPVDSITERNTSGQPEAYRVGYHDGCGSGFVAAGHPYAQASKNVQRYVNDQIYKTGWDDGFRTCKGQYDSIHI